MGQVDSLQLFKERLALKNKPFPLHSLLIMYDTCPRELYINWMEGFKILVQWLQPIQIDQAPPNTKIPRLFRTYEIQEIAKILNTTQDNIYHAYRHSLALIELQQQTSTALMPAQIPIAAP